MPLSIQQQLDDLSRRLKALEQRTALAPTVAMIIYDKEYDRVIAELDTLKGTYASHQTWAPKDRDRLHFLRKRKSELKTLLGISV